MATHPRLRFRATEIVSIIAAAIACMGAIASALVPSLYTYNSRNRELDIRLVEIGIGILRADPKETQTQGAREWAIKLIEKHAGQQFSQAAKQELLENKLTSFADIGGSYYSDPGVSSEGPAKATRPSPQSK